MKQNNIFKKIQRSDLKHSWVIGAGLIILGILWVTPVRQYIYPIFIDDSAPEKHIASLINLLIGSASILFAVIATSLYQVGSRTTELTQRLDEMKQNSDNNFLNYGTNGIYKDIDREITEELSKGNSVEVSILAYTLFSVTSKFQEWKSRKILHDITFNLYYLDIQFIKSSPDIDSVWAKEVEYHLEWIARFQEKYGTYLSNNKVVINLHPYHHIPAIHGFKLNSGTFYIACSSWEDGHIMPPYSTVYEKIELGDKSEHGKYLKAVFNNWLIAARESSKRYQENQNRTDEQKS
ncbi:hypothetical protein [Flavobacterium lindanitolerans]|uniref:hypothetical protein n=1 Tax=Flavobacterium lindanitolerans TaxID=428988 RepID=UPI0027B9731F|nr:hypothetical protein [Flavobacterium lindanitolerans]